MLTHIVNRSQRILPRRIAGMGYPYYLQHYGCSARILCPQEEAKKGLTRIGTLWRITTRQFPAFPLLSDIPPLRIAGIVCEEIRWRKKKP